MSTSFSSNPSSLTAPTADGTEAYWVLFRTLQHYASDVLPSFTSLADDMHRVDHVVSTCLSGAAASASWTAFTLPVYYAASQQTARAAALMELLALHTLRTHWAARQRQQKRVYGSVAGGQGRRESGRESAHFVRTTSALATSRPSRPSSANSRSSRTMTTRVGGSVLTPPPRPASASSSVGRYLGDDRHHSRLGFAADEVESESIDGAGPTAQRRRWSPLEHRRDQSGVRPSSSAMSSSSAASSCRLDGGGSRSSCFTFTRSNNYVRGGNEEVEEGEENTIERGESRLLSVMGSHTAAAPREPRSTRPSTPSVADLVEHVPQPEHAQGCGWQRQVCGDEGGGGGGRRCRDVGTTASREDEVVLPLMPASRLLTWFMECDTRGGAGSAKHAPWQFCPVCAAQLWVQRAWLCVCLLRRLDEVSRVHIRVAPLVIPSEMSALSPRECLLHRYHVARRLGLLGLEAALGACEELPITVFGRNDGGEEAEASDHHTIYEAAAQTQAGFNANIAIATMNTALELLAGVPVLWPALVIRQDDTAAVVVVLRAQLLRAALLIFTDVSGGAKGLAILSRVAEELDTSCLITAGYSTEGEEEKEQRDVHSDGVETTLRRVRRWHAAWECAIAQLDADKIAQRMRSASGQTADDDDSANLDKRTRALSALAQLQHVFGMLVVFAGLVAARDALEASLIQQSASQATENTIAAQVKVLTTADEHPDAAERPRLSRLCSCALPLMEQETIPFWQHARDAAEDGGSATRARQMLALTYLLTAEVHRCARGFAAQTAAAPQARSAGSSAAERPLQDETVRETVKQLAQRALRECGGAREFASTTMTLTTPIDLLQRDTLVCWRYRLRSPTASSSSCASPAEGLGAAHVHTLAVLPIEWIRLWWLLCPLLFPSSCLSEFMQLQQEEEEEAARKEKEKEEKDADGGSRLASPRPSQAHAPLVTATESATTGRDGGSRGATKAHATTTSPTPRRASQVRTRASGTRPVQPRKPAPLKRTSPTAAPALAGATAASPSSLGCRAEARETHLADLAHRLWYSPAALPFHWRWHQLASCSLAHGTASPRWVYAALSSSGLPIGSNAVHVEGEVVALDMLKAALTQGQSFLSTLTDRAASHAQPITHPRGQQRYRAALLAMQAVFPEPLASALLSLTSTRPLGSANVTHHGQGKEGRSNEAVTTTTTTTITAGSLRDALDALYGVLGTSQTSESEAVHENRTATFTAGTDALESSGMRGPCAEGLAAQCTHVRTLVEAYAASTLPPMAPLPATTAASAPAMSVGTTELEESAAAVSLTRRALSRPSSASPPCSPSPHTPPHLQPPPPLSRRPSSLTTPKLAPASSGPTTPPRSSSLEPAVPEKPSIRNNSVSSCVSTTSLVECAEPRSGSLASLSVPALNMRVAGRLSRRPVLLLATPASPTQRGGATANGSGGGGGEGESGRS